MYNTQCTERQLPPNIILSNITENSSNTIYYYYYRTTESTGSLDQQPLLLLQSALTENTNLLCSAIKIRCEFAYLHITAALSALETCQDHNLISANVKITVPDITLVFFSGDDGGSGLIDRFGGHAPRIYRSARGAEQD